MFDWTPGWDWIQRNLDFHVWYLKIDLFLFNVIKIVFIKLYLQLRNIVIWFIS